jgi:hypothetical protein
MGLVGRFHLSDLASSRPALLYLPGVTSPFKTPLSRSSAHLLPLSVLMCGWSAALIGEVLSFQSPFKLLRLLLRVCGSVLLGCHRADSRDLNGVTQSWGHIGNFRELLICVRLLPGRTSKYDMER